MFVYLLHYFNLKENGEIVSDIRLFKDYKVAKRLFQAKRDIIARNTRNTPKKIEFDDRNYYHTVTEEGDLYTLILKRKTVL